VQQIPVLQIGLGGVGRALVEQVLAFNERVGERYRFRFAYIGLVDRHGALVDDDGIPSTLLFQALATKRAGGSLADAPAGGPVVDWHDALAPVPGIVVDVTARDGAEAGLIAAIAEGHRVVLANKKPLCAHDDAFQALVESGRTRYEATVGAGLPIISTLRSLLDTGDVIYAMEGCFSGTLGFLMTQLEAGIPFSDAVHDAREHGWTEPDPRDDLSGLDVARKALILARTSGIRAELQDVEVEPLFPPTLASLSLDKFLSELTTLDDVYQARAQLAAQTGAKLRYVAHVAADGMKVGLMTVEPASPVGSLRGPDNLVVYHTQRYTEQPLSIRGPGAGLEVTAAAVLNDMIAFGREWQ
jgi:homoserine dehydrogenase